MGNKYDKYLGLQTIIGKSKKQIFFMLCDRLVYKFKGWKEKNLSNVGKEVLIKAVALISRVVYMMNLS